MSNIILLATLDYVGFFFPKAYKDVIVELTDKLISVDAKNLDWLKAHPYYSDDDFDHVVFNVDGYPWQDILVTIHPVLPLTKLSGDMVCQLFYKKERAMVWVFED